MLRTLTCVILLSICLCRLVTANAISENELDAIPTGGTANGFVVEDPHRGTMAIITSCAVTMGLCVWTALHLNIPAAGESTARTWLRNLYWTLIGLLAPELVVYQAWRQWIAANALRRMVNRCQYTDSEGGEKSFVSVTNESRDPANNTQIRPGLKRTDSGDSVSVRDTTWTMVHGFYGVMGGFTFDAETVRSCGIEPAVPMTLTPRGVALLVKCGVIPFVSAEDIEDKSKADGMAKLLVCIQAGYMFVQVIARKIQHLPITQLEYNTLGHVICALFIYILWWNKPWTIYSATILQGDWTTPVCAYMWMSSKVSFADDSMDIPIWRIYAKKTGKPELDRLRLAPKRKIPMIQEPQPEFVLPTPVPRNPAHTSELMVAGHDNWRKYASTYLSPIAESFRAQLSPRSAIARTISQTSSNETVTSPESPSSLNVLPSDDSEAAYLRYRLAMDAMDRYPALAARTRKRSDRTENAPGPFRTEELLVQVMSNWPRDSVLVSNVRGVVMGMALWFASMAFGAVHAAAWFDYFPTVIEAWMWRSAALYIVGSGFLWLSINCLGIVSAKFDRFWDGILAGKAHWVVYCFLAVLCSICGIAYAFARIYLVAESWVSLRDLPKEAFFTPSWEPWVPHF